ncbi:hypothetical protein D1007_57610 [Hordeum vulgare]|nr:hypothetical protein D1007_57610 [Hordeum vulgare]
MADTAAGAPRQKRKKKSKMEKASVASGQNQLHQGVTLLVSPVAALVAQPAVPPLKRHPLEEAPVHVMPQVQVAKKAKTQCWKCEVDTHATKNCTIEYYCYICDSSSHPLKKCPNMKLPRPCLFVDGMGSKETMFAQFPDIVHNGQLFPRSHPIAPVKVVGMDAIAKQVHDQVVRMCPFQY